MGYTLHDKPHPRGEVTLTVRMRCDLRVSVQVLVKSGEHCDGYYKEPALTSANFTPDGWFRTGDIGAHKL